jgi:hypothetical protein
MFRAGGAGLVPAQPRFFLNGPGRETPKVIDRDWAPRDGCRGSSKPRCIGDAR